MVPRILTRSACSVTTLLLLGAMPAIAGPIAFTGNVAKDFPQVLNNGIVIVPNSLGVPIDPVLAAKGFVSGWTVQDIRLSYDKAQDILSVGVNTVGIAGDADGNGDPGGRDPYTISKLGNDQAHFGGDKSITIGFANNSDPNNPVIVAGIPSGIPTRTNGITDYQVATAIKGAPLPYAYGTKLTANQGALAFDPSKDHPGFEFFISNFSKIAGLDPTQAMWISAFAGSQSNIAGETFIGATRIPALSEQKVPEPTTLLAWGLMAGGAALYARRRAARTSFSPIQ